ncbi:nitroimidazol reductase NimA-like FMN-containing flavoprotein (pyridoxamine 5'-phosphate oxidase superfamily) [Bradyrhizobium sp. USDA 4461]
MSSPNLRRSEKAMPEDQVLRLLERGYAGRLATISEDGYPYCIPLLYIWADNRIFVHGTRASGHLQANLRSEPRACFEVDEPGDVFDYGRFECDSGLAYQSVVLFGKAHIVEADAAKQLFCERLMEKYGKPNSIRPKNFFPRLDAINVYEMAIERMTGKQQALPELAQQWPLKDRTMTPDARP